MGLEQRRGPAPSVGCRAGAGKPGKDWAAALLSLKEGFVPRHVNLADDSGQALQFKQSKRMKKNQTTPNTEALGIALDAKKEIWRGNFAPVKVEEHK